MNFFSSLYCNQYFELKNKDRESEAFSMGNRLLIIAIALNIIFVAVLLMVVLPDFAEAFDDLIKNLFGRRKSRTVGKVVVLIPFLISFLIVHFGFSKSKYEQIIERFNGFKPDQQKQVSAKGLKYFIASIIGFFASIALALIAFG